MKLSPVQRATIRLWSRLNTAAYRASGGRLTGKMGEAPVLILTTTGRRSGQPRTAPLLYLADGDRYAIVASYGGSDSHPAWYLNLEARPEASVQVGRRTIPVRARTADGEERDRLWAGLVGIFPGYAGYEQRTSRRIPVVVLEPTA